MTSDFLARFLVTDSTVTKKSASVQASNLAHFLLYLMTLSPQIKDTLGTILRGCPIFVEGQLQHISFSTILGTLDSSFVCKRCLLERSEDVRIRKYYCHLKSCFEKAVNNDWNYFYFHHIKLLNACHGHQRKKREKDIVKLECVH